MIPRPEWMWNKGYLRGKGLLREAALDTLPTVICLPVGTECDNAITQCLTEVRICAIVH